MHELCMFKYLNVFVSIILHNSRSWQYLSNVSILPRSNQALHHLCLQFPNIACEHLLHSGRRPASKYLTISSQYGYGMHIYISLPTLLENMDNHTKDDQYPALVSPYHDGILVTLRLWNGDAYRPAYSIYASACSCTSQS